MNAHLRLHSSAVTSPHHFSVGVKPMPIQQFDAKPVIRPLSMILLSSVFLVGCGTPYVPMDNWTYSGKSEELRAPPAVPRGNLSGSDWIQAMNESKAKWFQERAEVIERAKDSCANETGASKTPNYWTGYARSFKACMLARGWTEGRSPL